jgi:hypothetical protein
MAGTGDEVDRGRPKLKSKEFKTLCYGLTAFLALGGIILGFQGAWNSSVPIGLSGACLLLLAIYIVLVVYVLSDALRGPDRNSS